jgi:uncharacterized protein with HEPN domain
VPSSDPARRFADILDSISRIERFTTGLDAKTFEDHEQIVFAVKYALMIISEAAVKLGDTATDLCPDVSWRQIRGLGNRLRHGYDTIDPSRLWLVIERDLPHLKEACQDALRTLSRNKSSG